MTDLEIRKWNTQNISCRAGDCLCSTGKRRSPLVPHKSCLYLHLPLHGVQEAQCAHDTWQFKAMLSLRSSALGQPACFICPLMWHTVFIFPGKPLYMCFCLSLATGQLLDRCAGDHHAVMLCENKLLCAHFEVSPDKKDVLKNSFTMSPAGWPWVCFQVLPVITLQEPNPAPAPWLFQHSGACGCTEKKNNWVLLKVWLLHLRADVEAEPLWK